MRVLDQWERVYKLTDQNGQTQNGCQWGPGVTNPHGVKRGARGLCSEDFYHAYASPELAAFLNPIHADIARPRLWVAEIRGTAVEDGPLKLGATEMRTVREIVPYTPTTNQCVAFSIYMAGTTLANVGMSVPAWEEWADRWLSGEDRSASVTWSAASAAWSAESAARSAESAAWSAARSVTWSAASAAWSAESAARSAESADHALWHDAAVFALQFED